MPFEAILGRRTFRVTAGGGDDLDHVSIKCNVWRVVKDSMRLDEFIIKVIIFRGENVGEVIHLINEWGVELYTIFSIDLELC